MPDEYDLARRQAEQARTDFAPIESGLGTRLDLTGLAVFTLRVGASATLMLIVAVLMGVVFWLVESDAADPCQRETPELMKPVAHCFLNPPTSNE